MNVTKVLTTYESLLWFYLVVTFGGFLGLGIIWRKHNTANFLFKLAFLVLAGAALILLCKWPS